MWSACNKLLERRQRLSTYRRHRVALDTMSPLLTISAPRTCLHLADNLKGRQLKDEVEDLIVHENRQLCKKMIEVSNRRSRSQTTCVKKSLREGFRNREASRIADENYRLGMKLQLTKPLINTRALLQETKRSITYSSNISRNARRSASLLSSRGSTRCSVSVA